MRYEGTAYTLFGKISINMKGGVCYVFTCRETQHKKRLNVLKKNKNKKIYFAQACDAQYLSAVYIVALYAENEVHTAFMEIELNASSVYTEVDFCNGSMFSFKYT